MRQPDRPNSNVSATSDEIPVIRVEGVERRREAFREGVDGVGGGLGLRQRLFGRHGRLTEPMVADDGVAGHLIEPSPR
ncbi:MAG: hypothetical protein IT180_18880 [Acidobacteria bacterium]|nr:hypothetical protein [Acidobacteriota bacterium]